MIIRLAICEGPWSISQSSREEIKGNENENRVEVFFDDFYGDAHQNSSEKKQDKVYCNDFNATHTKSPVIQTTDDNKKKKRVIKGEEQEVAKKRDKLKE